MGYRLSAIGVSDDENLDKIVGVYFDTRRNQHTQGFIDMANGLPLEAP